jgi:3-dehydroshikimate dehydratase
MKQIMSGYTHVYSLHRPEGFDQWSEEEKEAEYRYNAAVMRTHADHAEQRGKILLVENEPPTLTKGPRELGMLVRYAAHPHLKINWDIINSWWAGEFPSLESYEHLKGYVWQTHLKGAYRKPNSINEKNPHGEFGGFALAGEDEYDHANIIKAISNHDPQAVMTIDTHYPSLKDKDKIGEAEAVRRSKVFFESTLVGVNYYE